MFYVLMHNEAHYLKLHIYLFKHTEIILIT